MSANRNKKYIKTKIGGENARVIGTEEKHVNDAPQRPSARENKTTSPEARPCTDLSVNLMIIFRTTALHE